MLERQLSSSAVVVLLKPELVTSAAVDLGKVSSYIWRASHANLHREDPQQRLSVAPSFPPASRVVEQVSMCRQRGYPKVVLQHIAARESLQPSPAVWVRLS